MKTIVLIVIGLLVITLLVLAFCKKKTKTDTGLQSVTAYNPTSREYDYRQRENLVERERHVTLSGMGASVGGQDQTRL